MFLLETRELKVSGVSVRVSGFDESNFLHPKSWWKTSLKYSRVGIRADSVLERYVSPNPADSI